MLYTQRSDVTKKSTGEEEERVGSGKSEGKKSRVSEQSEKKRATPEKEKKEEFVVGRCLLMFIHLWLDSMIDV